MKVCWNLNNKGECVKIDGKNNEIATIWSSCNNSVISNIKLNKGKHYCEIQILGDCHAMIGICSDNVNLKYSLYSELNTWLFYNHGDKYHNGSYSNYSEPCQDGDIIGIFLDLDNGTLGFSRNGKFLGIAYDNIPKGEYYICGCFGSSSGSCKLIANFTTTSFKYDYSGYNPINNIYKCIIRKDNKYYSIKKEFYKNGKFISLDLNKLTDIDFNKFGFYLEDYYSPMFIEDLNTTIIPLDLFKNNSKLLIYYK